MGLLRVVGPEEMLTSRDIGAMYEAADDLTFYPSRVAALKWFTRTVEAWTEVLLIVRKHALVGVHQLLPSLHGKLACHVIRSQPPVSQWFPEIRGAFHHFEPIASCEMDPIWVDKWWPPNHSCRSLLDNPMRPLPVYPGVPQVNADLLACSSYPPSGPEFPSRPSEALR